MMEEKKGELEFGLFTQYPHYFYYTVIVYDGINSNKWLVAEEGNTNLVQYLAEGHPSPTLPPADDDTNLYRGARFAYCKY
jgi:hypothetical protein